MAAPNNPGGTFDMDSAQQADFFKHFYGPLSENLFNSMNVLHGRIRRDFNNFTGDEYRPANRLSFQGGFGAGQLPVAGGKLARQAVVKTKKVYHRISLQREAIKASMNNRGAFIRATKESMKGATESYVRNCSRILFGDGTGVLGFGDGTTNVTGGGTRANPYIVTISNARGIRRPGWILANFEEEDIVQVATFTQDFNEGAGSTGAAEGGTTQANLLTVVRVNPATRQIHLAGTSPILATMATTANSPFTNKNALVMQGSLNNEPMGLRSTVEAESGDLYGISVANNRRWQGLISDAEARTITVPMIRKLVLDQSHTFGKVGKLIVTSYAQYNNLLEMLGEGTKRYEVRARTMKSKTLQAKTSFTGISLMTESGEVGIFFERFCPDDRLYLINDNFIKVPTRPGHGWFDDDGRVLLREANSDTYEARYGGYWNNYIVPSAHAVLHNLAV